LIKVYLKQSIQKHIKVFIQIKSSKSVREGINIGTLISIGIIVKWN